MEETVNQPLLGDQGTRPPRSFLLSSCSSAIESWRSSSILRGSIITSTEERKLQKSYFEVLGICCSTEVSLVENILKSLDGIKEFSVIVPTKTVIVLHDNLRVSQLQIVIGTIAMANYTEAATIVFLFTVAEWLESRASHKASSVMQSMMSIAPQKAVIAKTGEEVDVGNVELNTILAVKAGELIPMDGVVVDGECEVDERTLTGESFPVAKQIDSIVLAGTINVNGYVSVKTTALAEDCVVSKMAKLVEESQNSKSKTQRFIDKCVQIYTPVVIIISACLAVIPAALRVNNRNHWFHLALVVLVSACPCALVLSTPVASFCALTKAAASGLLIKGGDYLEILAKIKLMAFDKTGTITRGEFVVTDFRSLCNDINLNSLLYWVSSIESKSSHPMAAALVDYGRSLSIEPKSEDVEEFQNFPGEGIYGRIDGIDVYIGNKKIALRAGCGTVPTREGDSRGGKTVGYIYVGASLAGIFSVSDACRSGVIEAVEELKLLGIKTAMLTGDSNAAALHVQQQLGNVLELVHAELLPEDKGTIIKGFKREGLTAMIGDGINDAPALAIADIGISMGIAGSALATETAHVILMSNDIRKIPKGIQLARKASRKVIENVMLSFSLKAAILGLAFAGHPLIWAAVLADAGTCLLVIFNSMLLLRGIDKPGANTSTHKIRCNTTGDSQFSDNRQHCCSKKKPQEVSEKKAKESCVTKNCCKQSCQPKSMSSDSCGNTIQSCCSEKKAEELCETEKCCKQSSASKYQPEPSSSDSCGNSLQPHCSEKKADKLCETEKCCTQSSQPKSLSSDSCKNSRQKCCSEKKVLEISEKICCTQICPSECQPRPFSSGSCGNDKCIDSADINRPQSGKAKCCDQGNCDMVHTDVTAQERHNYGCSVAKSSISPTEDKSERSLEQQADCTEAVEKYVVKNCRCCKRQNQDLAGHQDLISKRLHTTIDIPTDSY
ncbi:cadmium/zinc-transporting ATPase HMA2-like isoform X2 [Tripterygium wilfordii]|uniref:Cadmium/zinc-transporting ATPase HMA2-like isoform X2 n=1 Tax=Tripterygium wilfordii TaxID=458696 RepID=A0A7J7D0Y8_TRIWF|nr:cadmium/zinc-transporting ATPase HMA2-like isoform X2 [Tripterygium wilfordii]